MNDENNFVVCIISQIIAMKPISSQGAVDGEGSQYGTYFMWRILQSMQYLAASTFQF